MDIPLTPNKIQRLIRLAEDKSFNASRRLNMVYETDEEVEQHATPKNINKSEKCESSTGILDLDNIVAFGESGAGGLSIGNSTGFNPSEMSGRSTGTSDVNSKDVVGSQFERCGRQAMVIESLTNVMDKQTAEVNDLIRHSIAANYTFNSKPNLTADELSLVMREAPLPVMQSTLHNIPDNSFNSSSVSQYFMKRCQDLKKILGNVESPDKYMNPSITEVSSIHYDTPQRKAKNELYDESLDCVPVRQPRNVNPSNVNQESITSVEPKIMKPTNIVPNSSTRINEAVSDSKVNQTGMTTEDFINKMKSSFAINDGSYSVDSFSLSRIADYLGKQSQISVSDMLKLHDKNEKKKQPLLELNMNKQDTRKANQVQVTYLVDGKHLNAATSSTTSTAPLKENIVRVPAVVVTRPSTCDQDLNSVGSESGKTDPRTVRSKSPSSKSLSTLSTVQENYSSFRSGNSPLNNTSKGVSNTSHVLSANLEYKELDKSVDWREVLQQKRMTQRGLAKDRWADIVVSPVDGYVGARTVVDATVTTLTDTWLTGKISFEIPPQYENDITIELPRLPLLLSPGKSEKFSFFVTSNIQIEISLPFKMSLKDAAIESDIDQTGSLDVKIKMPLIQAMSSDGLNKLSFPPLQERSSLTKSLILINDCTADLQLDLSIVEGDSMFSIKSVKEIRKSDINKILLDRRGSEDEQCGRVKLLNKQLCRVTAGDAVKVAVGFTAPKLSELQLPDYMVSFQGVLSVNLIGVNCVIKKVDLIGTVGTVNLAIKSVDKKLQVSNDVTYLEVSNNGSVAGTWTAKLKHAIPSNETLPFQVSPSAFELSPGSAKSIGLTYTEQPDVFTEAYLVFEEKYSGNVTKIEVTGGSHRPKTFPIKTNHNTMSWVRDGRKELNLKNTLEKKIHIRCQIVGNGFSIDAPGVDTRGACVLSFGPFECKPLSILFSPNNCIPQAAALHLVQDKDSDLSRKIKLFGCASGESVCWSGLVTYGETALVRAVYAAPVVLKLFNRSRAPAFVAASVHFNLQYAGACAATSVGGARRVVAARGAHAVTVAPPWARVAARARGPHAPRALASLSVLAGPNSTRRRILRVLKDEKTGELDMSLLPEHLRVLADAFEGEDLDAAVSLDHFSETKASLSELIAGLQEMSAQIDLPPDLSEENTIVITDDTVIDHHTICN